MIIYALIDPRDGQVRYIGKSERTPHRRLRRHLAASSLAADTHKDRWLRGVMAAGLEPELLVLEVCQSRAALDEAERFHIAYWRYVGARLTNSTDGGDGAGHPQTAAARAAISRALTGREFSVEHRERIGVAGRDRMPTEKTRARLSAAHSVRQRTAFSAAARVAISRAKGGRPFTDQHGRRYETQKGAARDLGINVGHLNEVLHGRRALVAGFVFRFVEEPACQ